MLSPLSRLVITSPTAIQRDALRFNRLKNKALMMRSSVPAVVQAFAILRLLEDERAMTLSEIAASCSISPSSCLGLLRTLVDENVLQLQTGKRYVLTPSLKGFFSNERDADARLVARTRPLLERAARRWQAPTGLWRVVSRERLQLVALGESSASMRIHMEEGQRQPIGGGAVGRALAVAQNLTSTEVERRFAAVRWQKPLTVNEYASQIAAAAAKGYALDDGLTFAGVVSIAVVIPAVRNTLCLSVSVFAGSRTGAELVTMAADLKGLADDVVRQNTF